MSHCQIESIGSSLAACVELKELRLAHNQITVCTSREILFLPLLYIYCYCYLLTWSCFISDLQTIPSDLAKNTKLLNLDLGNNLIERVTDLKVCI
jgi:Leucine-rich repeat (LRR) protein